MNTGRTGRGMAALLCSLILLSGCALPGYDMDAEEGGYWYASDAGATWPAGGTAEEIRYDARMVLITPQLIRHVRQQRADEPLNPAVKALAANPAMQKYRVGPGDVLRVIVFGQPQLTNPLGEKAAGSSVAGQLVSADGTIFFPYVGEIEVAGLTLEQIREKITRGLSAIIRQPQVDVRVRRFRSKQVLISGDIAKPCTVPVTNRPLTIQKALHQCETLGETESGSAGVYNVTLLRDGQATEVNLGKLYRHGASVPLQPGDHLIIDEGDSRVFMVGRFEEQVALPYTTGGMMLGDAIAKAGGIDLETANPSSIYVIRGFMEARPGDENGSVVTLRPKVFHLDAGSVNALLLANNFHLQPRDVVYAAPADLVDFNNALKLLTPTLNLLFRSFLIYESVTDK